LDIIIVVRNISYFLVLYFTQAMAKASRCLQQALASAGTKEFEAAFPHAQLVNSILLDILDNHHGPSHSFNEVLDDSYWVRFLITDYKAPLDSIVVSQSIKESNVNAITLPFSIPRPTPLVPNPRR